MSDSRFMIKILSGLHTGAEYYLPPGETRLGASAQCDLVLHDKGIAEELFIFNCSEGGVEVRYPAQDAAVLLDGEAQTGPFTISEFGLLTSRALYLVVGIENKPWKIPTPEHLFVQPEEQVPPAVDAVEDAVGIEGAENVEDVDASAGSDGEEDKPDDAGMDEAEDNAADNMPEQEIVAVHNEQPSRRGWAVAGTVLVILAATGWYWYMGEPQPPRAEPAATRISLKQIETIAGRYSLDAEFELNKGNVLSVDGYALSTEDEHGFARAMYEQGVIVKASLIITEQFRNNIQNILDQYVDSGRNEQVITSIAEHDIKTLVLRGYVQDAEKWREVLAETVGEVDSINYIDEVTHWDDAREYLQGLVDKYEMGERIYLEQDLQNDRIFVYTPYRGDDEQSRLERLIGEYRESYMYPELLVDPDLGKSLAAPEFVESKLVGASFNARPYLLFDDGQRYFVGSVTRDGYRIEEINEEFAVFSRNNERYNYNFDDPDE